LEDDRHVLLKFDQLKDLAVLGSGTFGRVSLVEDKKSKQLYALKAMLKSEIVAHKQQKNVINEKNVMMCCNHPFILRLYQTFKDNRRLYMLLEFIQGGELFSVLHTNTSDGVPDSSAKFYAAGVILAIAYLHSKEIAYRDMKPENCLIDKFGYPKLVDFGFAKIINGKSYTLCGTPEYLAPELVLGRGHNKSVDYWAFGILIYEMQAGYSPFADNQSMDQVVICRNIVNCKLSFPRNFNADCKDLTIKLIAKEIHTRLGNLKGGTDDIKNHAWFKSLNFDNYMARGIAAPWIPKVKSNNDISNFDPIGGDDHVDNSNYQDKTNWDKDF
jgi:serine/threonine protein kinase